MQVVRTCRRGGTPQIERRPLLLAQGVLGFLENGVVENHCLLTLESREEHGYTGGLLLCSFGMCSSKSLNIASCSLVSCELAQLSPVKLWWGILACSVLEYGWLPGYTMPPFHTLLLQVL